MVLGHYFTYFGAPGWYYIVWYVVDRERYVCNGTRKVQVAKMSGLWSQKAYPSWLLGRESSSIGDLDPLGKFMAVLPSKLLGHCFTLVVQVLHTSNVGWWQTSTGPRASCRIRPQQPGILLLQLRKDTCKANCFCWSSKATAAIPSSKQASP